MNAVCTVVAKNYLSQARTLGDSLKKIHPDLDFHILLADECDGMFDLKKEKYNIIEVKEIGIPYLKEMAFKYNVLEFCTAVKPFFIEWLFEKYQYNKIIYLDPDIYVYNSLDEIYNELEENFLVITPHFVNMSINYLGAFSEDELLFVGIYNLGFLALRNNDHGRNFIKWWQVRLKDKCYADRADALHVDQKWIDFIPSFYEKGVLISKNMGYNTALWNIHEKDLLVENGIYYVQNKFAEREKYKLVFFHYSGLNPNTPEAMCRKQTKYTLSNMPEYREMFIKYSEEVLNNGFNEMVNLKYYYDKFENGIFIAQQQRRLYRKTLENDRYYENPFSTGENSFYRLLEKHKLIVKDKEGKFNNIKRGTYPKLESRLKKVETMLVILKNIIGAKNYFLFLRLLNKYCRIENQDFIIRK